MKKGVLYLITGVITAAMLVGCGSGGSGSAKSAEAMSDTGSYYDSSDDMYTSNYAMEEAAEEMIEAPAEAEVTEDDAVETSNRKIIKHVNIDAETEEFDAFISNVESRVKALGGYLENTNISGRSINASKSSMRTANITARIPSKNLDSFVTNVAENSNITNKSESAEDVTLSYTDTEAHIKSLRAEQERLNQLLLQADDIETIIAIESRITDVRYELESYESRLRTMDNKVDYSTVNIYVREVERYTPIETVEQTVGERIIMGFTENCIRVKEFITDFCVELIVALPIIAVLLVFLAIPVVIVFFFVKFIIGMARGKEYREELKKKRTQKKANKASRNSGTKPSGTVKVVKETAPEDGKNTNSNNEGSSSDGK